MFRTLYHYLILHQHVTLPGIGTIKLHRHPSQYNVIEKSFTSPSYSFELRNGDDRPQKKLISWFALERGLPESEARNVLMEFAMDIRNRLAEGEEVIWEPVGIFRNDERGNIQLESKILNPGNETDVPAEKVIRDRAQHTMRVGEREKTSSEMEVILTGISNRKRKAEVIMMRDEVKVKRRDAGFTIALILSIIILLFICIYFSQNGLSPASAGNQRNVSSIK